MLKTVVNSLGSKEKRVYRHISTGAFWAQDQLADIQLGQDNCPHCGQVVNGSDHVLWRCEAVHKHRKHNCLRQLDPDSLPKAVLNGLPPALTASLSSQPWGSSLVQADGGELAEVPHSFGLQPLRDVGNKEELVKLHAGYKGLDVMRLSARVVFSSLRHVAGPFITPVPW